MKKRTNQHTHNRITIRTIAVGFSQSQISKGVRDKFGHDFLVYEFAGIIAVASKLEITKRNILRYQLCFTILWG